MNQPGAYAPGCLPRPWAPKRTEAKLADEKLGYQWLIPLAAFLGLAPFCPQPHLVEKIGMLLAGTLCRPIDIFDLVWQAWPFGLLAYRIILDLRR